MLSRLLTEKSDTLTFAKGISDILLVNKLRYSMQGLMIYLVHITTWFLGINVLISERYSHLSKLQLFFTQTLQTQRPANATFPLVCFTKCPVSQYSVFCHAPIRLQICGISTKLVKKCCLLLQKMITSNLLFRIKILCSRREGTVYGKRQSSAHQ